MEGRPSSAAAEEYVWSILVVFDLRLFLIYAVWVAIAVRAERYGC